MERIFRETAPEVEIRGGMAFIKPEDPPEIAITVANLQLFVAKCNRALDLWHEGHGVIRFPPSH